MSAPPPSSISLPAKPPISHITKSTEQPEQPEISSEDREDRESNDSHESHDDREDGEAEEDEAEDSESLQNPPLPLEQPPVLPGAQLLAQQEDDGWEPVWDEDAGAFYFYNKLTNASQWENPRVPEALSVIPKSAVSSTKDTGPPGADPSGLPKKPLTGGYDPAIHGDYDSTADYAKVYDAPEDFGTGPNGAIDASTYAATGAFNRFTGKWQNAEINPEKFSDENKSKRQMNAFFDVDAAANAHNGKSLKAERSGKKLTKEELKAFKEKRRERKEEKRRAWLRD